MLLGEVTYNCFIYCKSSVVIGQSGAVMFAQSEDFMKDVIHDG